MKNHIVVLFLLSVFILSCKEKSEKPLLAENVEKFDPKINIKELEADFMKWWTYHSYNISLSSNFKGLNETSDVIEKEQFLNKLTSGEFIPLRLKSEDKIDSYNLHKLDSLADNGIDRAIKNVSLTYLKHFKMEGTEFPEFDFTDLNGIHYTTDNTRGKTIIAKTWFINCTACVAEFPELNELVEKYKDNNDIIFISLALDSKSELDAFLKKKNFNYQTVPDQNDFIEKTLKLQAYPTHLIVSKNKTILKVVNKASEMIDFLNGNNLLEDEANPLSPPPPPAPQK